MKCKSLGIVFLLLALLPKPSTADAGDVLTLVVSGKEFRFDLKELQKKIKIRAVSLDDPNYHERKVFDGFPLTEVLGLAGLKSDSKGDEIVFTAKDGYSPNTSFEKLKMHQAVLAFQEHGKAKDFEKIAQGKAMVNPGPYYVVWLEGKNLEHEVPWPYQLVKIEVVNFKQKYNKIYPNNVSLESGIMKGFLSFKDQCIRCHSLNLQGGDLGPELNAPKNVTEYWGAETLKSFITNSASFRYRDKMPSFTQLAPEQIDQIIQYLKYMKDRKITEK